MAQNRYDELSNKTIKYAYTVNDESETLVMEFTDGTKIEIQGQIEYFL